MSYFLANPGKAQEVVIALKLILINFSVLGLPVDEVKVLVVVGAVVAQAALSVREEGERGNVGEGNVATLEIVAGDVDLHVVDEA